jgi:hypothetical protein
MAKISTYASATPTMSDYVVGTDVDASNETKSFLFSAITGLLNAGTVPLTNTDAGIKGQIAVDTGFLYVCVATNTWKKVAIINVV